MLQPVGISSGGTWADLGSGSERFTLALAELLGENGTLYAIDRAPQNLVRFNLHNRAVAKISFRQADFTRPLGFSGLSGILMANSLHYVRQPERLLRQLGQSVLAGARLVVVEYETSRANPWIPYPMPFKRLEALYKTAGLTAPRKVHARASSFGRTMYVAVGKFL